MAKGTDLFKQQIKAYLDRRAEEDPLFAESYKKPKKSIDECINYILSTVQKSGSNAFAEMEIYSMAVHYWDEDNIKNIKAPGSCTVVSGRMPELTPEEKEAAHKAAIQKAQDDAYNAYTKRPKKVKKDADNPLQQTLFG